MKENLKKLMKKKFPEKYNEINIPDEKIKIKINYENNKIKIKIFSNKLKKINIKKEEMMNIFSEIKTHDNIKINSLMQDANIILIFVNSIQNSSTIAILNKFYQNYKTFLKMNSYPIIITSESLKTLQSCFIINENFSLFPRIFDENLFLFKSFNLGNSDLPIQCILLIEDFKIIHENVFNDSDNLLDNFDIFNLYSKQHDTKNIKFNFRNSIFVQNKLNFIKNYEKKNNNFFTNILKRKKSTNQLFDSPKVKNDSHVNNKNDGEDTDIIPMNIIINDLELLQFLKIHSMKNFCVENILFIEKVHLFKNTDNNSMRYQIANDIFCEFLFTDSINEVNTNNFLKSQISNVLDTVPNDIDITIFDPILEGISFFLFLKELKTTTIIDIYYKFVKTIDYKNMKNFYFEKYIKK
jgi:hypothetical protein